MRIINMFSFIKRKEVNEVENPNNATVGSLLDVLKSIDEQLENHLEQENLQTDDTNETVK